MYDPVYIVANGIILCSKWFTVLEYAVKLLCLLEVYRDLQQAGGTAIAFGNEAQGCYGILHPSRASSGIQCRKGKGANLFSGQ